MGRIDPFPHDSQAGEKRWWFLELSCLWFSTVWKALNPWIPQALFGPNLFNVMAMGGSTRGRRSFHPSEIQCWANSTAAESNQSLNPECNPQAHRQPDEGFPKIIPDDPPKISAFTIGEHIRKLLFFDP